MVALNEELIKLMVVWVLAYKQFRQVYDGVLFTAISALGFASNENIFLSTHSGRGCGAGENSTRLQRRPLHLCTGVVRDYSWDVPGKSGGSCRKKSGYSWGWGQPLLSTAPTTSCSPWTDSTSCTFRC
ncbi:TPA: hypothetical protein DCE37_03165 [Candidatus Latescibacteria bacterium]|nr:hypothetical protein [Candidatus Latescibacterota bacterium]